MSSSPSGSAKDIAHSNNNNNVTPIVKNPWWSRYEVPRKVLHSSIGVATLGLYRYGTTGTQVINAMVPSLIIIVGADLLRFNLPSFARTYESLLGPLMRPTEKNSWNGVIFYMLGVVSVLYVLPNDIATLSIVLLSWCDTAASTFGRAFGRYGPSLRAGKSLVGTSAAVATGALATWIFFGHLAGYRPEHQSWNVSTGIPLGWLSFFGGVIAAFSEFVDIWGVDDNLVIPVVSGGLLWVLLIAFGGGKYT